jgi:hypothetical protein
MTANQLMNTVAQRRDSWDLPDGDKGDDSPLKGGALLKFTKGQWSDRHGNEVAMGTRLLACECDVILQRWTDGTAATIYRDPVTGELPDLDELNEKIPAVEWELDRFTNKPRPPWSRYAVVYLLGEHGEALTFINNTSGGFQAYSDLKSSIQRTREFRGEHVVPLIELQAKGWTSPQYGPQIKPWFKIINWQRKGAPPPVAAEPAKQIETTASAAGWDYPGEIGEPVEPPSRKEELPDDLIPF